MLNASAKPMIMPSTSSSKEGVNPISSTTQTNRSLANQPQCDATKDPHPSKSNSQGSDYSADNTQNKSNETASMPGKLVHQQASTVSDHSQGSKGHSFSQVMAETMSKIPVIQSEQASNVSSDLVEQSAESDGYELEDLQALIQPQYPVDLSQSSSVEQTEMQQLLLPTRPSQEAGVVASLLGDVQKEITSELDATAESDDGTFLELGLDTQSRRQSLSSHSLLNQKDAFLNKGDNLQQTKTDILPSSTPLANALTKISGQGQDALSMTDVFSDETELMKFDSKGLNISSSLKGTTVNSELFLKQFQSQLQNNNTIGSHHATQPQILLNTDNVQTNGLSPSHQLNADTATMKSLQIETPVGQGQWSKQFNDQVLWMSSQKIQAAAIKLTPRDLGPVEINLKISNDVATIQFNSHSPHVRELIEQALPKLREQLSEQGIQLSDADVNDNSQQQMMKNAHDNHGNGTHQMQNDFFRELSGEAVEQEVRLSEIRQNPPQGLIDYFA